jgi:rhodanese-related sulfurtransferase/uncharacterized membrane protein YphA (DoxX/SURF4 family)
LKIFDLVLFEETIVLFNVFPRYSKLFTVIIPSFEVIAGVFLIIGIFRKAAIVVLIPLILSYIFAIWINLRQGFIFDCGCFGPLEIFSRISTGKLLFNVAIIIGLALVFFKDREDVDLLNHLKIVVTYGLFITMLIYIPFSNVSWAYTINTKNIKDIDWETANILIKNNAVLFDARTNDRYKKAHVPGALSLPFLDFNKYFKKYDKLSKDAFIIVYCDGKDCSAATRTSFKLIARGYKNIFKVTGGFDAWNKKN